MERKKLYLYTTILTLTLYILGFVTGIYVSKPAIEAKQTFSELQDEIMKLKRNLENIQLQQFYLSSEPEMGCAFLISDINNIQNDLGYFYQKLPQKLEVYEASGKTDPVYEEIKREYMRISLKVWILSIIANKKCKQNIVPILYFYSKDCEECIRQGEVLDEIRTNIRNISIFTIDLDLNEEVVKNIKHTYNITKTPALVIDGNLYEGLIDYKTLASIIRKRS